MILTSITSDFINNKNLNMKNFTNQNQRSYTDLVSTDAVKSRKLSLLWLMLLMLLFVPTRMVALTTTEDPRCAMFNDLDGISNATFTDNGDWRRTRQTLWGGRTDANPKLSLNDT